MYCSPYLQAAKGSMHGYDVVDPTHLNAELGGEEAFGRLVSALRDHG
jgi:(1->4)-alpha-D-glucan 1-alpha-D-glucosylmutase